MELVKACEVSRGVALDGSLVGARRKLVEPLESERNERESGKSQVGRDGKLSSFFAKSSNALVVGSRLLSISERGTSMYEYSKFPNFLNKLSTDRNQQTR